MKSFKCNWGTHWPGMIVLASGLFHTLPCQADSSVTLFPSSAIYPRYIADPLRPVFSATTQSYSQNEIAGVTDHRFDLKVGGALPVMQLEDAQTQEVWMQLTLEGGIHAQFDAGHSQDNIGWDGIYSFYLAYRQNEQLHWRFGMNHVSAHIGDELIETTGRTRIGYTRQEIRAGAAWQPNMQWLMYLDGGYGYDLRKEAQLKPKRIQTGLNYTHTNLFENPRVGGYAAMDISSYEENAWSKNTTLQIGLSHTHRERQWRLGIEYYRGRAQLGEFFQKREAYLGVGIWIDI